MLLWWFPCGGGSSFLAGRGGEGVGGAGAAPVVWLLCSVGCAPAGRGGEGRCLRLLCRERFAAEGGGAAGCGECLVEGSGLQGPELERFELGACRRPWSILVLDPVLRGWWKLRIIFAFGLEAPSVSRVGVVVFVVVGARTGDAVRRRREEEDGSWGLLGVSVEAEVLSARWCCWAHRLYPLRLYAYLYVFQFCILTTV